MRTARKLRIAGLNQAARRVEQRLAEYPDARNYGTQVDQGQDRELARWHVLKAFHGKARLCRLEPGRRRTSCPAMSIYLGGNFRREEDVQVRQ